MGSFCLLLFMLIATFAADEPRPRHLEEVTYDKERDRLLLFGGAEVNDGVWQEPAMLYEWDGKKWDKITAQGPTGRRGHGWVYDENRNETVLIGGVTEGKVVKDSVLFDVWHWNGKSWKLMNSICPVKEPEVVYDPVNKRILVYGDSNNKGVLNYNLETAFELWEYKNETWKRLAGEGPDLRSSRMLAYHVERKKLVVPVFEENGMTMWEWNGHEWTKGFFEKDCPAYRTRFALAYDPLSKVVVLFGGLSGERKQLGDFWKWDGQKWTSIESKEGPSVRNSAHFVFEKNQLILYGGSVPKASPATGIELSNEVWSWKNNTWKLLK
jgi:hypothetical protein